ncbi:MAG: hypothetical protein HYU51_03515 [Candidatus Rokubacteria bacterium]|nr:hypothetical protein [Candidatus Rokubacteria bacterium]
MLAVLVAIVLVALSACGTAPPAPSAGRVATADLLGTWTGTWGGTPLTVVIREQNGAGGGGGVYLGSWQVAGQRRPSVSGVMTYAVRGADVSTSVQGWLADPGRLTLYLEARPSDGRQELRLTVGDGRLTGTGTSSFRWGPQGSVELTRTRRVSGIDGASAR